MARGTRLLTILVHPSLEHLEVIQALRDKGHKIVTGLTGLTCRMSQLLPGESDISLWEADLILGPNCWRMTPALAKHVPLAVKNSRLLKYGPSSRKDKDNDIPPIPA